MTTFDEQVEAMEALNQWFLSQDIDMDDAAFIATMYAASLIGIMAANQKQLNRGTTILNQLVIAVAGQWFDDAERLREDGERK